MQHKIMRLSTNMVTIIPQTTAIITMNPAEMVSKRKNQLISCHDNFLFILTSDFKFDFVGICAMSIGQSKLINCGIRQFNIQYS